MVNSVIVGPVSVDSCPPLDLTEHPIIAVDTKVTDGCRKEINPVGRDFQVRS